MDVVGIMDIQDYSIDTSKISETEVNVNIRGIFNLEIAYCRYDNKAEEAPCECTTGTEEVYIELALLHKDL